MAHAQHTEVVVVDVPQTNSAGFWGFILSLLGVTCCVGTCISPIGMIVSLIGLGRQPRGFAIAGTVLGVIGTFGGVVFWSSGGAALSRVARNIGLMELPTIVTMWEAEKLVLEAYDENGSLPATLDDAASFGIAYSDQWGNDLVYRVNEDGDGFQFHSAGADGAWGTGDEVSYIVRDADDPNEFIVKRGTVRLLDATETVDPDAIEVPTGIEVEEPAETPEPPEGDGG